MLVGLAVHGADIQDRDGAPIVLNSIRHAFPWLRHIFADGGYAGPKLRGALDKIGKWTLQIVKRADKAEGFEEQPRRWVVERMFAWLGHCRRLAKDWERSWQGADIMEKLSDRTLRHGEPPGERYYLGRECSREWNGKQGQRSRTNRIMNIMENMVFSFYERMLNSLLYKMPLVFMDMRDLFWGKIFRYAPLFF